MTVASLAKGFLALVVLLIVTGLLGGIGSVELTIWFALVVAWIVWWMVSRHRVSSRP